MSTKKKSGGKPATGVTLPKFESFPVKPRGDRVIVKMSTGLGVTPGGIVLPEAAKEKSQVAVVVAVGPGRRDKDGALIPIELGVGDRVIAMTYAGSPLLPNPELGIREDEYQIMREEDIIAVV